MTRRHRVDRPVLDRQPNGRVNRVVIALAIFLAAAVVAGAQDPQGWRTPNGELYFGSAPPPGSTRIEVGRPRRTMQPTAPPPTPRATVTPKPTATQRPTPVATATNRPKPTATSRPREASPQREESPIDVSEGPSCGDVVAIRDTRPTIDFEADRVVIIGEVVVTTRPVKNLSVCLGGSCTKIAGGKILADGETARFRVQASGTRRTGLSVRCSVL